MAQVGRDLDFAQEPITTQHGSEFRAQHLDCDLALVFQVVSQVDRRHPTGAEFTLDGVTAG